MSLKHAGWREAARAFLLSRLLFLIATLATVFFFRPILPGFAARFDAAPGYTLPSPILSELFYSWLRWDVKAFLNVSYQGYSHTPDISFFPLFPMIQHVAGLLLGNAFPYSFYIAGLLLSNLFFYLALVLCYQLLAQDFDPSLARRTLFCLAFAPYALFFFAGYSESLFLLLCFACFLLLQNPSLRNYWLAGLVGFCAGLTRSVGIVLIIPFLCTYYQHFWSVDQRAETSTWQKVQAGAPMLLIIAAVPLYLLYLWISKGSLSILTAQEANVWGRALTAPWTTLILSVQAIIQAPAPIFILLNTVDLLIVGLTLLILGLGWRHIPRHYLFFALAQIGFDLLVPSHSVEPLLSQTRFMLPIFPIAVILAFWGKKPLSYRLLLITTSLFLLINTILFLDNIWVA